MASEGARKPVAELSEEELEQILVERAEQEGKDVLELAKTLNADSPCPVCGNKVLDKKPVHAALRPFVTRDTLACDRCEFTSGPPPNPLGKYLLVPLTAGGFLYAGMQLIFTAQRLTEERGQMMTFVQGFALFGVGLFVWYSGMGAANPKQRQQRILKYRRAWEDEQAGVAAPDTTSLLGENLEAVVVAIILALIIRHFVMEAFVIPTGSMAPTLLGDHFDLECERCGHPFPIAKREYELTQGETETHATATCPVCDYTFERDLTRADMRSGHKILVNKFIYRFRPPRRYEVVVFKFPNTPWRNYIKRLVGLPGETITVRNGDVFANGERARKPDHVIDSIWIPVHDAAWRRTGGEPRWDVVAEDLRPAWQFGKDGAEDLDGAWMRCDPAQAKLPAGQETAWVGYQHRKMHAAYAYNREDSARGPITGDLRVRARVTPEAGAVVRLGILETTRLYDEENNSQRDEERLVAARFEAGQGETTYAIEAQGEVVAQAKGPGLTPGVPHELTLAYADDRARLQLNGETVLAWDDPFGPIEQTYDVEVRLGAAKAPAVFEQLRIDRDVYYVPSRSNAQYDPSIQAIEIPKRSYFVMGDNSPNSEDGRSWGFVREGHMIGRAFLVFWPPTPEHLRLIR